MSRRTPPGRLQDVASAACRVFIRKGYRRALLTDVGEDLGLSHAVLYRYVASKEALFELALAFAADPGALSSLALPVPAPPPGRALEIVNAWAAGQARFPALGAACGSSSGDAVSELGDIIDECYAFIERNHRMLALIERSALDMPDLHARYFGEIRPAYIERLAGYLRRRADAGLLRPPRDAGAAARFIVESIAWFAWHRTGDPGADVIGDDTARLTARDLLLAAFTPAGLA